MSKGVFIKIIPEKSRKVKDFYLSDKTLRFLKLFSILFVFFLIVSISFSFYMLNNMAKMKYLERRVKILEKREKKIEILEHRLQKFKIFSDKIKKLLFASYNEKDLKKVAILEKDIIKSSIMDEFSEEQQKVYYEPFLLLPVKGIISASFSVLHSGIDIVAPLGSGVYAVKDGIVKEKGYNPVYGFYIWLEHKGNIRTFYAHLGRVFVRKGEWVRRGEKIAEVGLTGKTTGPHLHYEVWQGSIPVNPLKPFVSSLWSSSSSLLYPFLK